MIKRHTRSLDYGSYGCMGRLSFYGLVGAAKLPPSRSYFFIVISIITSILVFPSIIILAIIASITVFLVLFLL